jgi:hypothetical protein
MRMLANVAPMRALAIAAMASLVASLGGCGGGGGDSGSNNTPPNVMPTQNVQPVTVDQGPGGYPNLLFTSVTICGPGGSATCATIDHIQIDTGSSGLRIMSSALPANVPLRQLTDANGNAIVECAQFADGFTWGPVMIADIRLAGEVATSIPVQVIGDPRFPNIPASCSNIGPPQQTPDAFGANGLLGIGLFIEDCGAACVQSAIAGAYYVCAVAGCQPARVIAAQQVQNPVAAFATDNNGVVITLPSIPATGAPSAVGSLIFGIGTQADNAANGVTVLQTDPNTGHITTVFNNQTYMTSYIDSGSNGLFFGNGVFPSCPPPDNDFYCPATTQSLTATLRGTNGASANVNFLVANADQLNLNFYAFNDLAGPTFDTTTFAWGLPFFYGRSVFTAIEGRSTPVGTGPFVAF